MERQVGTDEIVYFSDHDNNDEILFLKQFTMLNLSLTVLLDLRMW